VMEESAIGFVVSKEGFFEGGHASRSSRRIQKRLFLFFLSSTLTNRQSRSCACTLGERSIPVQVTSTLPVIVSQPRGKAAASPAFATVVRPVSSVQDAPAAGEHAHASSRAAKVTAIIFVETMSHNNKRQRGREAARGSNQLPQCDSLLLSPEFTGANEGGKDSGGQDGTEHQKGGSRSNAKMAVCVSNTPGCQGLQTGR
jgi:hypothetical protein